MPTRDELPTLPDGLYPVPVDRIIQARNFTPGRIRPVDLIVLHTMEAPEKDGTALAVAKWFASVNAPKASAHYCLDAKEVIQCVDPANTAWHAPGANANGIGIEHAGYARQNTADWEDAYSDAMLDRSARLTADLCRRYGIPVQYVDRTGLLAGLRGVTTHAAVSLAFRKSTHTDPGPRFPMLAYLERVRAWQA